MVSLGSAKRKKLDSQLTFWIKPVVKHELFSLHSQPLSYDEVAFSSLSRDHFYCWGSIEFVCGYAYRVRIGR